MIRIELPVDVARPVHDVFAYVTDVEKLAEWQPNAVSGLRRQFSGYYERLKSGLEA